MYSLEYMFILTASVNHPGKNCATSVFTFAASAGVTSDGSRTVHKSLTVIFTGPISNMTSLSPLPQFAPFLTRTAGPHFPTLSTGLYEENKKRTRKFVSRYWVILLRCIMMRFTSTEKNYLTCLHLFLGRRLQMSSSLRLARELPLG